MGADPGRQELAEQMVRCIDRALDAVRGGVGVGVEKKRRRSAHEPVARLPAQYKRRAICPGPGVTVARVVSPTMDDGFAWRKYGEKSMNQPRCRRFYFRCTYRDEHGCSAKKQVQQMQDGPSLFETTYLGKHTPACPRDTLVAVANCAFVPQVPFLASFRPGAAGGYTCLENMAPSFLAEEMALMPPNLAEFSGKYWPAEDRQIKFVSADPTFPSPARELESFDDSLEELVSLLWS
ncbi:hypothetical protein EJB05_36035, partial [Eragrostis curvula]